VTSYQFVIYASDTSGARSHLQIPMQCFGSIKSKMRVSINQSILKAFCARKCKLGLAAIAVSVIPLTVTMIGSIDSSASVDGLRLQAFLFNWMCPPRNATVMSRGNRDENCSSRGGSDPVSRESESSSQKESSDFVTVTSGSGEFVADHHRIVIASKFEPVVINGKQYIAGKDFDYGRQEAFRRHMQEREPVVINGKQYIAGKDFVVGRQEAFRREMQERKLDVKLRMKFQGTWVSLAPKWAMRNFRRIVQEFHLEFRVNCMYFRYLLYEIIQNSM
jgi:hypothetical protein